jgi:hypothetical protein
LNNADKYSDHELRDFSNDFAFDRQKNPSASDKVFRQQAIKATLVVVIIQQVQQNVMYLTQINICLYVVYVLNDIYISVIYSFISVH